MTYKPTNQQLRILGLITSIHASASQMAGLPFGEIQKMKTDLLALHSLFVLMLHQEQIEVIDQEERLLSECSPYTKEQIRNWIRADRSALTKAIKKLNQTKNNKDLK